MYTNISGMRSARYPLMGLGACRCAGQSSPLGACPCAGQSSMLGQTTAADTVSYMLPVIAIAGLVLWLGMGAAKGHHGTTSVAQNAARRRRHLPTALLAGEKEARRYAAAINHKAGPGHAVVRKETGIEGTVSWTVKGRKGIRAADFYAFGDSIWKH